MSPRRDVDVLHLALYRPPLIDVPMFFRRRSASTSNCSSVPESSKSTKVAIFLKKIGNLHCRNQVRYQAKYANLGFGDILVKIGDRTIFLFEDNSSEIWGRKKIFLFGDKSSKFGDIFSEF